MRVVEWNSGYQWGYVHACVLYIHLALNAKAIIALLWFGMAIVYLLCKGTVLNHCHGQAPLTNVPAAFFELKRSKDTVYPEL